MPYAICRVAKIKTAQAGAAKTAHNYRQRETPNADTERKPLNREYINTAERNYWELATERIQEAGAKVRHDSVRGVEVLLTASPEAFKRQDDGTPHDWHGSQWAEANIAFLKGKFGEQNVVSCTLHQDELTPHFHAVVVPLTADGRLSAKDVFNPKTLRALQTEYAEAMKPFGMERGVEHSRAKHEVMRHVYGAQERSRGELATLTKPEPATRLSIEGPSGLDLVNLSKWRADQEARLNAELTRQLAAANERASKAASIAQDSAGAKDREKTLARQLASVEGTKTKEIGRRELFEGGFKRAAVLAVQGETLPAKVLAYGQQIRSSMQAEAEKTRPASPKGPYPPSGRPDRATKKAPRVHLPGGRDHQTGRVAPHGHRQPVRAGRAEAGRGVNEGGLRPGRAPHRAARPGSEQKSEPGRREHGRLTRRRPKAPANCIGRGLL
ncbi:plasmid recombination protein (plasmid) [Hymenobacter aerilatus]|uniref:Plasmid recombination protein n=2 Tax=Hymenobacter TaxID=89966 RepID=A0A8T9T591_9BACT|nr:MobV family relaxase [Hymenobacter aerilatus]UOR07830.1 plasmid recombination protein [Hymenobacter aerilatus]